MKLSRHLNLLRTIAEDLIPVGNAKLASAILYRGTIVSIGVNQDKSHPFAAKYSKHPEAIYLHAEADAIMKAKKKLSAFELRKSTLITVRVKCEDGVMGFGLAKPCSGCRSCIEDHEIRTIIYTDDGKMKYITEELNF